VSTLNRKVEPRRFRLKRIEDESGVSGTGYVAEGIKFSDGQTVINWLTDTRSIGIYHSIVEMIYIHGHGGKTVIEWVDEESLDGSGGDIEVAAAKSSETDSPSKTFKLKAAKNVLKNNSTKARSTT
jgi:hypothetical protein